MCLKSKTILLLIDSGDGVAMPGGGEDSGVTD
jgi:hypothetical protein